MRNLMKQQVNHSTIHYSGSQLRIKIATSTRQIIIGHRQYRSPITSITMDHRVSSKTFHTINDCRETLRSTQAQSDRLKAFPRVEWNEEEKNGKQFQYIFR